uniref:Uncharacterized protein n=1 Tax=viral metagenome TaxID=1070528 RepID=A0A6C0BKG4_9ZZZZ
MTISDVNAIILPLGESHEDLPVTNSPTEGYSDILSVLEV